MKKKMSLFLSMTMLVSSLVSFNAHAEKVSFTDVTAETKYQPAIVLTAIMKTERVRLNPKIRLQEQSSRLLSQELWA